MHKILQDKKSQSEVITTVLLILIGIAAVVIVSGFVINLVRSNLKNTDCLDVISQIKINLEGDATYYDSAEKALHLSVERELMNFNLSGFLVTFGNEYSSKTIRVKPNSPDLESIQYVDFNGEKLNSSFLRYPDSGEIKSYIINATFYNMGSITKVAIAPIINKDQECNKADEQIIKVI